MASATATKARTTTGRTKTATKSAAQPSGRTRSGDRVSAAWIQRMVDLGPLHFERVTANRYRISGGGLTKECAGASMAAALNAVEKIFPARVGRTTTPRQ